MHTAGQQCLLLLALFVHAEAFWQIASGATHCVIEESGRCLSSGQGKYGNGEHCTAIATANFSLVLWAYGVEGCCDYLSVNGTAFKKTDFWRGPDGVRMLPGDTLAWYSDNSSSTDGWKVCADYGSWQGADEPDDFDPFLIIVIGVLGPILGCMLCNFMIMSSRGSGPPRPSAAQRRYYHSTCPLWDCVVDLTICILELIGALWQCGRFKCRRCCALAMRAEPEGQAQGEGQGGTTSKRTDSV